MRPINSNDFETAGFVVGLVLIGAVLGESIPPEILGAMAFFAMFGPFLAHWILGPAPDPAREARREAGRRILEIAEADGNQGELPTG